MTAAIAEPVKLGPEVVEATKNFILDATNRCDRCGAQAYVMVTLTDGKGDLYFCRHHARKWEKPLKEIAETWYSEESRLSENKKQGSEN